MSSGDWFDSSEINKTLCMVVNKAAQNYFDTSYAVGNVESSLSLTPFNVVGTVNDGTDIPTVYLDAHSIELLVPNMWKVKNATVHWHSEAGITMRQMYSSLHDILEDTIGGNLDIIGKSDIGDTYNSVLSVLQLGLLVTSFLLLFVSVLGQINICLMFTGCSNSETNSTSRGLTDFAHIEEEYLATIDSLNWPDGITLPDKLEDEDTGASFQVGYGETRASYLWEYSWMKEWLDTYNTDPERAEKALEELEKAFDMPYMGIDRCDDATRNYLRENIDKAKLGDPSGFTESIRANYAN